LRIASYTVFRYFISLSSNLKMTTIRKVISFLFCFLFLLLVPFSSTERNLKPKPRIVGGTNAALGEFPYQGLFETVNIICGCSLLNSRWAITDAHCTYGLIESDISLYFGIIDRTDLSSYVYFSVQIIEQHPDYDNENYDTRFDISLLKIEGEVTMSDFVAPIALPSAGDMPSEGQLCNTTGWGSLDYIFPVAVNVL